MLLAFGLPLAAFGTDGWNLPLQINGTTVPYPLTFLEGTLINLGVIYLVLLAMIGVTLFLSARMKSPYLVPNFGSYLSYQIGPVVLDAFTARAVLYGALALLLIPLAGNGFKKHQVA